MEQRGMRVTLVIEKWTLLCRSILLQLELQVMKHVLWGSRAFVGTIFTSAPLDDEAIQNVLNKMNEDS